MITIAANFAPPDRQKLTIKNQKIPLKNTAVGLAVSAEFSKLQIKGNISYQYGERIYHMLDQEDYFRTRIY